MRSDYITSCTCFSAKFFISEALARVAGLSHFFFTENLARGIDGLNTKKVLRKL